MELKWLKTKAIYNKQTKDIVIKVKKTLVQKKKT